MGILSHPLLQSPRLLPRYPIPSSFLYTSVTMAPLTTELTTPITGTYQQPIGLFIDGKWVEDIDLAVAAARKAFEGEWKKISPQQRGNLLLKLADLAEKNLDLLAAVESLDNGKSITNARGDVGAVVGCLRYYGGWADKIEGKTIDIAPDMFHYTRSEPIGVCGQIIPWNFPLLMLAWKIGPALATGNTIVMKTAASSNLKKVTLELGGKSPNIVFEDADIDEAI